MLPFGASEKVWSECLFLEKALRDRACGGRAQREASDGVLGLGDSIRVEYRLG